MSLLKIPSIGQTVANSLLADPTNWRAAVSAVASLATDHGLCYSSGQIAQALRELRPDLRFSVLSIGQFLSQTFYDGNTPKYTSQDANGTPVETDAVMEVRVCVGLFPDRTPAGTVVNVYGPDYNTISSAEFEVFIPNPQRGETIADAPATATPDLTAKPRMAWDNTAKVWVDGRLAIPRSAVEFLVATNKGSMADTFVVVQTGPTCIAISTDPHGANATFASPRFYKAATESGRIAFPPAPGQAPFDMNKKYTIEVGTNSLVINL